MTKRVIGRVLLGAWLGCFTAAAAQLPPEIVVDRYLLRAERLMETKDPQGALELMGKIVALQKEHGLTLPEEFHFKHAKVALSAGSIGEAMNAVNTYLVEAGRGGKFYREALELLEEAEQLQSWFDAEQTCAGKSEGAECWKELTGEPGCYVWDDYLIPDQTVTWTGECAAGRAQGEGTLKWVREEGEKTSESTGRLTDGKQHGKWVVRYGNGTVLEGSFVEGTRQGEWVGRYKDGSVHEGTVVDGKRHGQWVLRLESGEVQKGPFVEGKKHGHWIWRGPTGAIWGGPFVDDKRHGEWVEHDADGSSRKGPYVGGEKHGHWAMLRTDGSVYKEGPYVEGERHGQWVERRSDGSVDSEGPYVEGEKHGHWAILRKDGRVYTEGPYVEGEMHGHWAILQTDGSVYEEGPYVEGKKHGHWREKVGHGLRIGENGYNEGPYVEGKMHGTWLYRDRIGKNRARVEERIYENGEYVRAVREWKERYPWKKKK